MALVVERYIGVPQTMEYKIITHQHGHKYFQVDIKSLMPLSLINFLFEQFDHIKRKPKKQYRPMPVSISMIASLALIKPKEGDCCVFCFYGSVNYSIKQ